MAQISGLMAAILIMVSTLVVVTHGQAYGSGCAAATLPTNIRVWAIPDALFVPGPPASGFLVDLLDALKGITGIPYTLSSHTELSFGSQQANGSFDGSLIGALVNNQADLVGTDITITSYREAVVDFLIPFQQYDLQIVANVQQGIANGVQYVAQDDADLQYLKNSKNATLNAIYANVQAGRPGSIVNDDASAIAKVSSGNFAYIGESNLIASALAKTPNAAVQVLPGTLGSLYLALAVQQGSPLRETLNVAMLQLAESGTLQSLIDKARGAFSG